MEPTGPEVRIRARVVWEREKDVCVEVKDRGGYPVVMVMKREDVEIDAQKESE